MYDIYGYLQETISEEVVALRKQSLLWRLWIVKNNLLLLVDSFSLVIKTISSSWNVKYSFSLILSILKHQE